MSASNGRLPPHDIDAERAVLGAVLIDPACIRRLGDLRAEHFYSDRHRAIWRVMLSLSEHAPPGVDPGIDLVTIAATVGGHDKLAPLGGASYLAEIASTTPTAANAEWYARIVLDNASRRALIKAGVLVSEAGADTSTRTDDAAEDAETAVVSIVDRIRSADRPTTSASVGAPAAVLDLVRWSKHRRGTGFADLDSMFRFPAGGLTVLGGLTGSGKTTLALNMAEHIARRHGPVLVHSAEMNSSEVFAKLIARRSGISAWDLGELRERDDPNLEKANRAAEELRSLQFHVNDRHPTIRDVLAVSDRQITAGGLALVVVDYLQLFEAPGAAIKDRWLEVGRMSRALKTWAQRTQVPVVAVSQLNREAAKSDRRPTEAHLRESGNIEQDADAVLLIHAPDERVKGCQPCENWWPGEADTARGLRLVEVIVAKQRMGSTGVCHLYADLARSQFLGLRDAAHETDHKQRTF